MLPNPFIWAKVRDRAALEWDWPVRLHNTVHQVYKKRDQGAVGEISSSEEEGENEREWKLKRKVNNLKAQENPSEGNTGK